MLGNVCARNLPSMIILKKMLGIYRDMQMEITSCFLVCVTDHPASGLQRSTDESSAPEAEQGDERPF